MVIEVEGGGVLVRKDAVRELVRDIVWDASRSFATSRSFSRRSATSLSRDDTSTGLHIVETTMKRCGMPRTAHYRMD